MSKQSEKATSKVVIGIDLGTTNSCVAITEGRAPRVLISQEGTNTTPSVVAYKGNETLVGIPAKRQAVTNPTNTFFSVKRFIGRAFDEIQSEIKTVPYKVIREGSDRVMLETDAGKKLNPEEISAKVLSKMKSIAEESLNTTITDAVITVPAYFDDTQKQATKAAGKIAGLNVLRLIPEPTAAALAYGFDKSNKPQKIAVFDLGGGTFDVSILDISDGVVEVLATNGDNHLGGDDFDNVVVEHLISEFKKETGIDIQSDKMAMQRVKDAAEKAKMELSGTVSTEINLPFITMDSSGPKHLHTVLSRAQFEKLADPLIRRLERPCVQALEDAKLSLSEIDIVLPVGGMTRMPKVVSKIKDIFGKDAHKCVNPDEVVATGAAIQGAVLGGDISDIVLLDVLPLSVGIETKGSIFAPIIPRNSTIPTEKSQIFSTASDNQTSVSIRVLQGASEIASRNKEIASFDLTGIPPAARGTPQIEVKFRLDSNGILHCSAKDLGTNQEKTVRVEAPCSINEDEIDRLVKEAEAHQEEDKKAKEVALARNDADAMAHQMLSSINEYKDKIPEDMFNSIEESAHQLQKMVDDQDVSADQLRQATESASSLLQKIGQHVYQDSSAQSGGSTENTGSPKEDVNPDIEV